MKAVLLLIKKTFQKKWRMLLLGVLAMGLLLGCFIAVFISAESMEYTILEKQTAMYGTQHAVVLNAYPTPISASSAVKTVGTFQVYGVYEYEKSYQPIALGTVDEKAIALNHLQLAEGRWPEEKSEVVVEKWVFAELEMPAEIDVQLTFCYYALGEDGSFSVERSADYTVVGILENYANIQINLEETEAGFKQLPNIISAGTDEMVINHISLQLQSQTDVLSDNQRIHQWLNQNNITYSKLVQNRNIYEQYYQSSVENATSSMTVTVFSVILILCGLILAVVFLYLWVVHQQKALYLLRQIGAEKRDLFLYHFLQICGLIVLSIPIGFVLGFLCHIALTSMLLYVFNIAYTTTLSISSVILGVGIYLGVSLFAGWFISFFSLRSKERKAKKFRGLKRNVRIRSAYLLLAYKEARGNSKQFFSIVISMCLCFFMLTVGSLLAVEAEQTVKIPQNDYVVRYPSYTYATSLMIPMDMQNGFWDADLKNIVTDENIQNAFLLKRCDMNWIAGQGTDILEEIYMNSVCRPSFSTETEQVAFQEEKKKYGYLKEDTLYCAELLGVTNEMFETFSDFSVIGELNQKRVVDGEGFVLCVNEESYKEEYQQLIGTQIIFTQIIGFDPETNEEGIRKDFPMEILAIVVVPKSNALYSEMFKGNINFVVCNDTFAAIDLDIPYQEMYLQLHNPEQTGNLEDYLAVLSANTSCNVQSRVQINMELQKQKNTITLAAGSIVLILACVIFVILLLQYFIKLHQRKELYARLHVIGMTKVRISLLLLMDYILCVLLAVAITFPALTVFIVFTYSVTPDLLSIPSLLIINGAFLAFLVLASGLIFIMTKRWMKKNL